MKRFVAIILFIFLACSLFGCNINPDNSDINGNHTRWDFYPEGYTAGFPYLVNQSNGSRLEFWWVETYEECIAAIELLEENGSSFAKTAIFTYDGDLFDTKYLFKISHNNKHTEEISFGDNPFDRRAMDVEVASIAFFDEVTIDEINHGDLENYEVYEVNSYLNNYSNKPVIDDEHIKCEWGKNSSGKDEYYVRDLIQNEKILMISSFGYNDDPNKANECIRAVLNSLCFLGFNS